MIDRFDHLDGQGALEAEGRLTVLQHPEQAVHEAFLKIEEAPWKNIDLAVELYNNFSAQNAFSGRRLHRLYRYYIDPVASLLQNQDFYSLYQAARPVLHQTLRC